MKTMKMISALLALILVLGVSAALAEPVTLANIADSFDVTLDSDQVTSIEYEAGSKNVALDELLRVHIAGAESIAPVHISVALDELADGASLKELGEDRINSLSVIAAEQYDAPVVETMTTEAGTLYIIIRDAEATTQVSLITVYKGFFVEMNQYHPDGSELTEADGEFIKALFKGLWIVDHAA